MRNELQMPVQYLSTAVRLDCRQSLDEVAQIARNTLQIVFHVALRIDLGSFQSRRFLFLLVLTKVIDLFCANTTQ